MAKGQGGEAELTGADASIAPPNPLPRPEGSLPLAWTPRADVR